jgi:hypothetical protein
MADLGLGISWEAILQGGTIAGVASAIAMAVVAMVRVRPSTIRAQTERDSSLRHDLIQLYNDVRTELGVERAARETEQKLCAERIDRVEQRCAQEINGLKEAHNASQKLAAAQVQVIRHERNNLRAAFNAMIILLKRHPERIQEAIEAAEETLQRGDAVIAKEKAAIPLLKGEDEL